MTRDEWEAAKQRMWDHMQAWIDRMTPEQLQNMQRGINAERAKHGLEPLTFEEET